MRYLAIFLIVVSGTAHAICDTTSSEAERRACLNTELRLADVDINSAYTDMLTTLGDAEKTKLRAEQRDWLKRRSTVCRLDVRETDRERWLQSIERDLNKTVCTIQLTRAREQELTRTLKSRRPSTPANISPTILIYDLYSLDNRGTGKWYFEVRLDKSAIAEKFDAEVFVGMWNKDGHVGNAQKVRRGVSYPSVTIVGFAIDLDAGKRYVRINGVWPRGAPGAGDGLPLKSNRYVAGVSSSVPLNEFLERGTLEVNLGQRPFVYDLPSDYRAFDGAGRLTSDHPRW